MTDTVLTPGETISPSVRSPPNSTAAHGSSTTGSTTARWPRYRYGSRFIRITRAALDEFKAAHSTTTPREQRARLLGEETVRAIAESAAAAPPLTEEQQDIIRGAFQGGHVRVPYIPPKIRRGGGRHATS